MSFMAALSEATNPWSPSPDRQTGDPINVACTLKELLPDYFRRVLYYPRSQCKSGQSVRNCLKNRSLQCGLCRSLLRRSEGRCTTEGDSNSLVAPPLLPHCLPAVVRRAVLSMALWSRHLTCPGQRDRRCLRHLNHRRRMPAVTMRIIRPHAWIPLCTTCA